MTAHHSASTARYRQLQSIHLPYIFKDLAVFKTSATPLKSDQQRTARGVRVARRVWVITEHRETRFALNKKLLRVRAKVMEIKTMFSVRQILKFASFALTLLGAFCAVQFWTGENKIRRTCGGSSNGIYDRESSFSLYTEIARLALKEPDARLLMSVKGVRVRQIADTWGAPRSIGREHKGQDIFAKRGTPVLSATEGYVLRVGESKATLPKLLPIITKQLS